MTYYTIYDTYNMLLSGTPSIAQVVPTTSTESDSNNDDPDPSTLSNSRPVEDGHEKQLDDTGNLKNNKRPRTENNNPNGARNNRKRGKKKSLASASWPLSSSAEDSCSLFVRGLPRFTTEEALSDFFSAMFLRVGSTSAYPRCFIRRHKDDARVVLSDPSDVTWALKFGDRLFRGVELEILPWHPKTSQTFGGKPNDEKESLGHYVPNNYNMESASTPSIESEFLDGRRQKDDSRSVLSDDDRGNYALYDNDINASHACEETQSSSVYNGSSKWDRRAPSDMHEASLTSFVRPPKDNVRSDISGNNQGYYRPSDEVNNTTNVVSEDAVANTSLEVHASAGTVRGVPVPVPCFNSLRNDDYSSCEILNRKEGNDVETSSSYHTLEDRATTSINVPNTIGKCHSSASSTAQVVAPSCFFRRRKSNARVVFSDDVQIHSLGNDGPCDKDRNLSNVPDERVVVSAFTTVRESEEPSKDGTHASPLVAADVSRAPRHEGAGNVANEGRENTGDNEVARLKEALRLVQEKYQRDLIAAQAESEKKLSQKEADYIAEKTSIQSQYEQEILAAQKRLDYAEKEHTKEKAELVRRLTEAKEQRELLQDLMDKQQKDKDALQVALNKQKVEIKKKLQESYSEKFHLAKAQIASDTSALTKQIGTLKKQLEAANKKIATLSRLSHENSQQTKPSDTTTKKSTEQLHESSKTMMAWKIKTEEKSTKISELEMKLLEAQKENEKLVKENEEAMKIQKESFAKLKASSLQEKKSLAQKHTSEKQVLHQQIAQLNKESDQRRESSAQSLEYSTNVDVRVLQERIEQLTKEKKYIEQKNIETTISMSKQITDSFDQKELLKEQLKREKALRQAAEAQLHSFSSKPDLPSNHPRLSAETTCIKRSTSPPTVSNGTSKNDVPVDFGEYDV